MYVLLICMFHVKAVQPPYFFTFLYEYKMLNRHIHIYNTIKTVLNYVLFFFISIYYEKSKVWKEYQIDGRSKCRSLV